MLKFERHKATLSYGTVNLGLRKFRTGIASAPAFAKGTCKKLEMDDEAHELTVRGTRAGSCEKMSSRKMTAVKTPDG